MSKCKTMFDGSKRNLLNNLEDDKQTMKLYTPANEVAPVVAAINAYNKAKQRANNAKRRLRTTLERYSFLDQMVDDRTSDDDLVKSVCTYLQKLNIGIIRDVSRLGKEDIQLETNDTLYLIEVTSTTGSVGQQKAHQSDKHKPKRQEQFSNKDIRGIYVFHFKKKLTEKPQKRFPANTIDLAIDNKNTLCATDDLVSFFIEYSNGKYEPKDFLNAINKGGEFKI